MSNELSDLFNPFSATAEARSEWAWCATSIESSMGRSSSNADLFRSRLTPGHLEGSPVVPVLAEAEVVSSASCLSDYQGIPSLPLSQERSHSLRPWKEDGRHSFLPAPKHLFREIITLTLETQIAIKYGIIVKAEWISAFDEKYLKFQNVDFSLLAT